jgi:hypothetical protein
MNAEKNNAVRCFMPITRKVNEPVPGRHRFIGVHRRLSAANYIFQVYTIPAFAAG